MKLYIAMSAEQDERAISHLAAAAILRHLESYEHASIERPAERKHTASAYFKVRHNFLSTNIELQIYPDQSLHPSGIRFRLSGEVRDEFHAAPAEGSTQEAFDEYLRDFNTACAQLRDTVTEDTANEANRLVKLAEEIDRTDTLTRLVTQAHQDLSAKVVNPVQ